MSNTVLTIEMSEVTEHELVNLRLKHAAASARLETSRVKLKGMHSKHDIVEYLKADVDVAMIVREYNRIILYHAEEQLNSLKFSSAFNPSFLGKKS